MNRTLTCLLLAAAVVAANPFVETYLSEVGVDPAYQFVELRCAPSAEPVSLSGWKILTSSSACTLDYTLGYDEVLVVDSAALAEGLIGRGTLRVNPLGDSLLLLDYTGSLMDRVHFPRYPTGHDSAPLPPATGSISFWNYDDFEDQSMNWYLDSTPTPGEANDDYSAVAGTLTGSGGVVFEEAEVVARGVNGRSHKGLYQQSSYGVSGLGAGKYLVSAWGCYQGHEYSGAYPESVTVGYGQAVSGIDIVLPMTGVADSRSARLLPLMRVSGRALLLSGDGSTPVSIELYSQAGSRVNAFHLGPITGERRIELPAALAPGVYFAVAQKGTCRSTVKVVLW